MSFRPPRRPAGSAGFPVSHVLANTWEGPKVLRKLPTRNNSAHPDMKPEAEEVSPHKVLAEVVAAVPGDMHPNIIIIGSLAAGYWLFQGDESFGVRTKDVDCVLSPNVSKRRHFSASMVCS